MTLSEQLQDLKAPDVSSVGESLLSLLSEGAMTKEAFLADPVSLVKAFGASRYLAQVTHRAIQGEYETREEVLQAVRFVENRNPPSVESRTASARLFIPEARVLAIGQPARTPEGDWVSFIDAFVTSGDLRHQEVRIHLRASVNRAACLIVSYLWTHASFSIYNLVRSDTGQLEAIPETFLVIEPMHQVNVTAVAKSLYCPKPQLDQVRKGRGDVTIHTLKGTLVHAMFDRILVGDPDLERAYRELLPGFAVQLASVTDDFFREDAFRSDVLRHARALQELIGNSPHLVENPQLELKRYSATLGIQGRIDALCRTGNRLDILELKTGQQIRSEDHVQVFIYRLLLSEMIRRWQKDEGIELEIVGRILSSVDGTFAPMRPGTDFHEVLDARNKLVSLHFALSRNRPHVQFRYAGFDMEVCRRCPGRTRASCEESSIAFGDRPGTTAAADLAYFRTWSTFVQREKWLSEMDVADLLDDSRLDARAAQYRTIAAARIDTSAEPFTFRFETNTSDLNTGDNVLIHAGHISSTETFHGYVRSVDHCSIQIFVPLKNVTTAMFEGKSWTIDRVPADFTSEASQTALYDFLRSPQDARKSAILSGVETAGRPLSERICTAEGLNPSQRQAVEQSLNCTTFHLIWGPPGTGKTRIIAPLLEGLGGPALLGAFTNTAVDKMLLAIIERDASLRFLRVGRSTESPELAARLKSLGLDPQDYFTEDTARKLGDVVALREYLRNVPVVAATAHRAATTPFVRNRVFEMAIVDEAGQLTEPLALALIMRARRFVLIGDDKQLPPVSRVPGLQHSLFERLKRNAAEHAPESLTLLDTQYRMHPAIMDLANRWFYDGRLKTGVASEDRTLDDGYAIEFVPVEPATDGGRTNASEVDRVVEIVDRLAHTGCDIGVISPYRAQVALLRQRLAGTRTTVDTVERFQGGERDVIIVSFVRPNATGFVFDDRRLNVAITRARRKLVLVAHPNLFRESRYSWICTFTETRKIATAT